MNLRHTLVTGTLLASVWLAAPRSSATDGKWNYGTGNDNWSTASRWTNNQVANGVDAVANMEVNYTAARTVTVNMPVTVGRIRYNDTTSTYYDFTLSSSGGNLLTLQTSTGTPVIDIARQTVTFSVGLAGTSGFQKIGGGTLALSNTGNSNNLSGNVTVSAGVMRISSESCLGAYPASYVADRITLAGGVLMNNSTEVTLSPNSGITLGSGGGGLQAGWGRPLTVNGVISGSGDLTLRCDNTPGAISLNANNTHTGKTIIGNTTANNTWAVALVNGSLAAASRVQVLTNGFLGGTGTVNGPVGVGDLGMVGGGGYWSPGTLTLNNALSATNATLKVDLAGTTEVGAGINDLLQVNGDVTLRGVLTVSINALSGSLATGTYRLINYTGTLDATGATLVCDNPRLGATFDTATPGQINLTIANGTPAQLVWSGATDNIWNIAGTSNFLQGGSPDLFYQGDAVTFDDSGSYANPITLVAVGPGAGTVQPASVTVNTTNDMTLTSSGYGRLGGAMGLYKGGSGSLSLQLASYNNPNSFDGPIVVTNGTLKIGNPRVLGSTAGPTIVTNLGRFDTSGQTGIIDPMVLQGAGPDGSGAVVNSGGQTVNDGFRGPVTLAGDTTINATNRFDFQQASLQANGYKLTKLGPAEVALENLTETGLGDIDVNEGILTFLGNTTATNPGTRIAVVSNAAFTFWSLNNTPATPLVRDLTLTNGNFRSNSGTNYHLGTITLDGTNGLTSTAHLSLFGPVVGPGAMRKTGAGVLVLEGANTYSGATLIDAGTLVLGTNASLTGSAFINVTNGATLDVTQPPTGLTLAAGQTLAGAGTVYGTVTAGSGTTLNPGSSPGTLTIAGALNLSGAFMPFELGGQAFSGNDQIIAYNGLNPTGLNTIKILPLGALDTANPYTLLINYGTPMPSGSESHFKVTTDSRYNFTLLPTDSGAIPGASLQVQVSGAASSALLTWQGADSLNPTLWDLKTTTNWLNGTTDDKFYSGDTVVFDDTAIGTSVDLVGTVQPGSVLLSNASKSITLGGAGALVTPSLEVDGAGTTRLANASANQFLNGLTLNAGTFVVANSAANDFGPAINLTAGTLIFDQPVDTVVSAPLVGNGALRKENTNTLTLSGVNFWLNPITVNNGILRAGSYASLSDPGTPLTINPGASLDVNGFNLTNKVVRVSGAGFNGLGAIINRSSAGAADCLQNLTLTGDTVFGGPNVWDFRSRSGLGLATFSTEGHPYNLTKIGPQRFSIVNASVDPALANIEVKEGIFSYEEWTTGLGDPASTITVRSNAYLTFYRSAVALNKQVVLDDGANIRAASGTTNFLVGPVLLGGGTINAWAASGFSLDLDGPISGPGGLVKVEAGTLTLGASNSFAGDINVNLGNLVLSNSFAAGSNKTVYVTYNNTVSGGTGTRLFLRGGITTPPDLAGYYTALSYPGDYRCSLTSDVLTNVWTGPTILEGNGLVQFYRSGATAELDLAGPIYGTNGFSGQAFFRGTAGYGGLISGRVDLPTGIVAITDNVAWQFSHPDNLMATNLIAYGKFILGGHNAACPSAVLVLGQPGSSSGTLDLNGFNQTVSLLVTVNGANHWITNGSATADSVFTYAGGTTPSTLNGGLVDGARTLALTVSSGTLTLAGNNSYKGTTLISGGRLALGATAQLAGTPLITLNSGATLDTSAAGLTLASGQTLAGSGNIDGSLTVGPGATLAAAGSGSLGALTISNALTFAAAGTNVVDINSGAVPSSDVLNAAVITYGGTLVVNNLGPALTTGSFKLFNAAAYSGSFDQVSPATPGPGLRWDTSTLTVDGTLRIAPAISLDPAPVSVVVKPGGLDLSWPADHIGWRLETQSNPLAIGLSTNWTSVAGSADTNSVSILFDQDAKATFFRLVYP